MNRRRGRRHGLIRILKRLGLGRRHGRDVTGSPLHVRERVTAGATEIRPGAIFGSTLWTLHEALNLASITASRLWQPTFSDASVSMKTRCQMSDVRCRLRRLTLTSDIYS